MKRTLKYSRNQISRPGQFLVILGLIFRIETWAELESVPPKIFV